MLPWIIGAAGTYLQYRLNKDAQNEANYQRRVADDKNAAMQKEFAQKGIQWKAADARAAGIHPLAAMGAQTHQPQAVFGSDAPDFSAGEMAQQMGQNISRAVSASSTKEDRDYQRLMQAETLTNAKLKNSILAHQLTFANEPGNPPMQSPTGTPMGQSGFSLKPAEATASQPGVPAQEAGAINDYGFARTQSGGLTIIPSKDMKERMEDDTIQELSWAARNRIQPFLKGVSAPDPKLYPLPPGAFKWEWNPGAQEFQPAYTHEQFNKPGEGKWKRKLLDKLWKN